MRRFFLNWHFSRKSAEILFALVAAAGGIAVITGAREMETGWSGSGPEAGYFPFRIGLLILATALAILLREALRAPLPLRSPLIGAAAAGRLLLFVLPLAGLIALVPRVGFYPGAALYLAVAIGLVGRNGWRRTLGVMVLLPAFLFVAFEHVFRSPLPKGPLGAWLGLP